nr:hypothetical protein [Tanacetum cinerariifolium]
MESLKKDLKQTKQIYGAAYTKLIKKVKKLEKTVKSSQARRRARIVVSDDEDDLEDSSKQVRKIATIDQDPAISLVQHDAQTQGRYGQYMENDTSVFDTTTAGAEISTASPEVKTAGVSVDDTAAETLVYIRRSEPKVKDKGKGIMKESESPMIKTERTKRQQERERLGLEAAVKLQKELDEEERQRIARRLQTEEREKYSEDEQAKMLVDLVNQRKRYFAAQRAEAKRNKPITQAKQRTYIEAGGTKRAVEEELGYQSSKKQKSGELSQEELHQLMIIVPEEGMDIEALLTKYLIIDFQERFNSTEPTEDKEREIWVELKKLFELDANDELLKSQKHIHHGNMTWRLYDTCGVHHVSTKDGVDIYMMVEREYQLSRGRKTKKMKCLEASSQSRRFNSRNLMIWRHNRVLHRATLASSSIKIDLEGASLDNSKGEYFGNLFESDVEVKEEVEIVNLARGVDTYFRPGTFGDPSPVVYRTGNNVATFQLKHSILNILSTFRGTTLEEPYDFISEFFSIADTHEITSLTKDDIRLRLFSYTFKDRAKHWFNSLSRQSVTAWDEMQKLFLEEFYPISKTSDVRNKIKSFRQIPAASGGLFFTHSSDDEWTYFGTLSKGSKTKALVDRNNNTSSSLNVISESTSFQKEVGSKISDMNQKINLLIQNFERGSVNVSHVSEGCVTCGAMGPSRIRNHPNMRYGNTSNILNPTNQGPYQSQQRALYKQNSCNFHMQNRNQGRQGELSLEKKMDQIAKSQADVMELLRKNEQKADINSKSITAISMQVGQLANKTNTRLQGTLSSTKQLNPQHQARSSNFNLNKAQINEVTIFHSGKMYDNKVSSPTPTSVKGVVEDYVSNEEELPTVIKINEKKNLTEINESFQNDFQSSKTIKVGEAVVVPTPYPIALEKPTSKILAYAKFLKDLCTQKRRHKPPKKIEFSEQASVILSSTLPPKLKDSSAPLISVDVGNIKIKRALLDLGASVNVLSGTIYDKYDFDTIDDCIQSHTPSMLLDDSLEKLLFSDDRDDELVDEITLQGMQDEFLLALEQGQPPWSHKFKNLPKNLDSHLKPSLENPPLLELKTLPSHLKYAFLGLKDTLPIIISSSLSTDQEEALLKVLSTHKVAVGWTIADLKGISPSICMHRIITEPQAKSSRETQRRLNPNMQEVVKKEVLKWLDAGIIYPISNSEWVSPTQTLPKKAGIQIVKGKDWKEVATRYNQIPINPKDQHKTTFTCPYGTLLLEECHLDYVMLPPPFKVVSSTTHEIQENFLDEQLLSISKVPWFANYVNYLVAKRMPEHWTKQQQKHFLSHVRRYIWDDPELFKIGADQVIRRCVPDHEIDGFLAHCHSYACGGHFSAKKTRH